MYGSRDKKKTSYLGVGIHDGSNEKASSHLAIGIALGVAIGAAFGVAFDNLALGIGFGTAMGVAVALALSSRRPRKAGESGQDAGSRGDRNGNGA